jgi:hypothetical protein
VFEHVRSGSNREEFQKSPQATLKGPWYIAWEKRVRPPVTGASWCHQEGQRWFSLSLIPSCRPKGEEPAFRTMCAHKLLHAYALRYVLWSALLTYTHMFTRCPTLLCTHAHTCTHSLTHSRPSLPCDAFGALWDLWSH